MPRPCRPNDLGCWNSFTSDQINGHDMSRWDYHYNYNGNTIFPGGGGPGGGGKKGPHSHPLPSGTTPGGMTGYNPTHQGGAPLHLSPLGGLFYYKFNPGSQLPLGMDVVAGWLKRQRPTGPRIVEPEQADPLVPIPKDEPLNEFRPKLTGQDELLKEFDLLHGEDAPIIQGGYDAEGFRIEGVPLEEGPGEYAIRSLAMIEQSITGTNPLDPKTAHLNKVPKGTRPDYFADKGLQPKIEKKIGGKKKIYVERRGKDFFTIDEDAPIADMVKPNPFDPTERVVSGDYFEEMEAKANMADELPFDKIEDATVKAIDGDPEGPELGDDVTDAELFEGFDAEIDAFEAEYADQTQPEFRPDLDTAQIEDIVAGETVAGPLDAADIAALADSDLVTNMINHSIDSVQPGSLVGWDESERNLLGGGEYNEARWAISQSRQGTYNPIGTGGEAGRALHPMEGDPVIETLTNFQLRALDIADQQIVMDRAFNTLRKKPGGGYYQRPANQQAKLDMKLEYAEMVEHSGFTDAQLYQPGTNKFKSEFSWNNFIKDLQAKRTRITGITPEAYAVQRAAKGPEMGDADPGLDPFEDEFNLDMDIETGKTGLSAESNAELEHLFGKGTNVSDLTGGIGDMEYNTTESLGIDTSTWTEDMIADFDFSIRTGHTPAETFKSMDRGLGLTEGTMAGETVIPKLQENPFADIVKPGTMIEGFGKNVPTIGGNWGSEARLGQFEEFDIGKKQAQLEAFGEMGEPDIATEFVAEYGALGSSEAMEAFGVLMEMGNIGMTLAAAWQATQVAMDGYKALAAGEKWHPIGKFKVPFTEFWKDGGVDPEGALHSAIHMWLVTTFGPGAGDIAMSVGETLYNLFAGNSGLSDVQVEDEWIKQLGFTEVEEGGGIHDISRFSKYDGPIKNPTHMMGQQTVGSQNESKRLWENKDGKIYDRYDIMEFMPQLDMTKASDADVLDLMYKRMGYTPNDDGSWTAPMGQKIPEAAMKQAFKLPVKQTHQYRVRESHWNDWNNMVFYEHTEDQEWQDAPPIASSIWDFFSEITHPPTDPAENPYNLEWGDTWLVGDYGEEAMIHTKIYDNADFTDWWESGGRGMTTYDVKHMSHDEAAKKYEYFMKETGHPDRKWGYEGSEYHDVGLKINADFDENVIKYNQQQNEEMMERARIHAAETNEQNAVSTNPEGGK